MNKKKAGAMSLAVLGIVFLVYHLLVFLLLKPKTEVFWISYGFMIAAFVLQILGMRVAVDTGEVRAIFFGIPLAQFTVFYFFAELFMSTVFMLFQIVHWKIPLLLQIILLAVYAVVAIVSLAARDTAQKTLDDVQTDARQMRLNTVDVEMLRDGAADPELKAALRRLADTVRYSDPRANAMVADVDARIGQEMAALQVSCEDGDLPGAKEACARLQRLYVERNKKLLASK